MRGIPLTITSQSKITKEGGFKSEVFEDFSQ